MNAPAPRDVVAYIQAQMDAHAPKAEAPEPEAPELESSDLGRFEPTPYDLGITDDPDAGWPPPVNGIRPSPEAVAAHFEFASVAEMETAAQDALDADIDAEVEARLEGEALEADGELELEAGL